MSRSRIWSIAGGKGGVGKSFLSCNLGINLAQKGYSVVLIDADFGGANLHTFFGVNASRISISDFIKSSNLKLEDILLPTKVPNLKLASGAHDVLGMAKPNILQQNKMIKAVRSLRADFVIIDLGAGTAPFVLDLFLIATKGVLITAPEPTSIENTYLFIKSAFYRKLKSVVKHPEVRALLERVTESKSEDNPNTPAELLTAISNINLQAGETLKYEISRFNPKLVINQVRTPTDVRIGFSMRTACEKYFGINLDYTGFIEHDNTVLQSVRLRQPEILFAPDSKASNCIKKIAHNIRRNYHLIATN